MDSVVRAEDLAQSVGSGDLPVLATPRLIALMECASMKAVSSELEEGQTTVGAEVKVAHLRPSKEGSHVEIEATLEDVDGRRLTFDVTASEEGVVIGRGKHVRYIVDRKKFMSKLN